MSKIDALALTPSTNKGDDEDDGPFLRVTGGLVYNGRYDVDTSGIIFWRGDTRAPNEVFATGLSSRFVRDGKGREIVWRAAIDDIVQASAVCLARDVRGAAFFPYPPDDSDAVEDTNYLYAMWVPRAACTFDVQRVAEQFETKKANWRDPERYEYDPEWDDRDAASCVWQFGEYAVHEVPRENILGGWRCRRMMLVRMRDEERVQAGIRFRLDQEAMNPRCQLSDLKEEASSIAGQFSTEYPRRYGDFLSYWGIVRARMIPCSAKDLAKRTVTQVNPIVVYDDHQWSVRDDDGEPSEGAVRLGQPQRSSSGGGYHL